MSETFKELVQYIKNPILEKDTNQSLKYRFQIFTKIFIFCAIIAIATTPLFSLFEELKSISLEDHKVEELFKNLPFFTVILIGGVVVPILEELIFRAPIILFKKPKSFKITFYTLSIIFGLIHITNFEFTNTILILAPLLVLPQLFTGFCLAFLRVRFGLRWSILLHCVYNVLFLSIGMMTDM